MDRTNVTSSGYTFNGQNFTNETRTDSQGNNYTVAVPSTISTATLSTPTTLPVTQPQYNTSGQQSLASQAGAYVNTATTAAEQALQAEQDALKASQTDIGRLLTDAGNKGTDIASQYNQQDATGQSVNSLAAKRRQLSARSNALSIDNLAKSQGEINKATGQNITQSAVTRNTADATRENLINQASIAMELAIVDADYQSAKSYADQMVDAKYDQLEANTKAALFNLENNKERFTAAEKKVAEATAARLKKEEADIAEKKANEKAISDLVINAATQDAPKALREKAALAKTPAEAANILGVYAGDYLKNELLKENIKKAQAEIKETNAKITALNNKTDQTNLSGKPLKVPNNEITDLNSAIVAKNSLNQLVNQYKEIISRTGTQTLAGKDAGDRDSIKTSILFAMKNLEKTGALDKGSTEVLAGNIPESKFFNTESGQTAKLDSLLNTVNSKTDEYISSYKGTSAELDPRTRRAYVKEVNDDYLDNVALPSLNKSVQPSNSSSAYANSLLAQ